MQLTYFHYEARTAVTTGISSYNSCKNHPSTDWSAQWHDVIMYVVHSRLVPNTGKAGYKNSSFPKSHFIHELNNGDYMCSAALCSLHGGVSANF